MLSQPVDWWSGILFAPGVTLVLLYLAGGKAWGFGSPAALALLVCTFVLAAPAQDALLSRAQNRLSSVSLSAQEIAVLQEAAQGRTNAAIGLALHISETTVKTYLSRAFDKLGVTDRTSAVRRGIELGLID